MFMFLVIPALLVLGVLIVFLPVLPVVVVAALALVAYRIAVQTHGHHGVRGG